MSQEIVTETWFRNPELYVKELVELRTGDIVWDRGYLHKKSIDPAVWADLYYPQDLDYTMLVVGDHDQGTLELRRGDTMDKPFATHETWAYGDDLAVLESMMETPEHCDSKPRVIVTDLPPMNTSLGRGFLRKLKEIQQDYPGTIMHIHGLYAWRLMFALPFGAVDIDPRTDAKKGKIMLPTGRDVKFENAGHHLYWVNVLGFRVTDLPVPRNRCMFNVRSAQWAGRYYRTNIKMKSRGSGITRPAVDTTSPQSQIVPVQTASLHTNKPPTQPGDKFVCDSCSLQTSCKYYRAGSVCSVPDSEPSELARFFKTRDSGTIIEGLGNVMAVQAQRLNEGRASELDFGELDPEVTRVINSLMTNGIKLAKLVNPQLAAAGAPKHQTNVLNLTPQTTPQAIMAGIVAELEAQGVPREKITQELVLGILEKSLANGTDPQQAAIAVAHVERDVSQAG